MSTDADILAAALLSKGAHDLRNKANGVVSASDMLKSMTVAGSAPLVMVREILDESESEMCELSDRWSDASSRLYVPTVAAISVGTLLANLGSSLATRIRLELDSSEIVHCDERVLALLLARLSRRETIGELVASREESYGITWLVIEAHTQAARVESTLEEQALLRMLDAQPLARVAPGILAFRLRLS